MLFEGAAGGRCRPHTSCSPFSWAAVSCCSESAARAGGLVDAFKGGGGGSSTDSALEDRVDSQEERLAKNPQNEAVLQSLIRDYYSLATSARAYSRTTPRTTCARPASTGSATRGRGWGAECRGRPLRPPGVRRVGAQPPEGGAEGGGDPRAGRERRLRLTAALAGDTRTADLG